MGCRPRSWLGSITISANSTSGGSGFVTSPGRWTLPEAASRTTGMPAPDIAHSATVISAPPHDRATTRWQPGWRLVRAVIVMLPILLAVDVVPDMFRTVANVTADVAATTIVAPPAEEAD